MERAKKVVKFYALTNILKDVVRTGWLNWHVKASRVESVAEHIYGVQMLAIAMYSEYEYDLDFEKVIFMLAVHELEEIILGDLTYLQISAENKIEQGHKAIEIILHGLLKKEEIKAIIHEFDAKETAEAKFAYHCDKLECDLQCKLYDESHYVDPYDQGDSADHKPDVMEKLKSGEATWSELWMNNDRHKYTDDDNFMEVLDYALDNSISLNKKIN